MMKILPWMYNHDIIANITPEYRYDGKESFEAWQKKAKDKLRELLGMKNLRPSEDTHFTIEHVKETDEYTEYRFTLESEVGYIFPSVMRVPKGIEGLLVAGRCISGTHEAMASYRVTGPCAQMGEAAGYACAQSAKTGTSLRKVDVSEIKNHLYDYECSQA